MHIIELNDRNIRVSNASSKLSSSPGFANTALAKPVFGEDAQQQSRLHPRQSFNQFWSQLSLDPLVNSNSHFRHQADLAYGHLNNLASLHDITQDVIFAVPSNYSRNQLAILLGLVKQSPFNAVGLVDLAVLSAAHIKTRQHALFVDVQLHQTVLTTLEKQNGQLTRGKVLQIPGTGLLALHDAWANMITDEFINQSRFDPQHNADTEQYVYNQLKQWLADTVKGNEVLLEINNKGSIYQAKVNLGYFEQRSRNIINRIKDEIHSLAAADTTIYLPASVASLPGLTLYLSNVVELDDSALAENGFANLEHIVREPDSLGLVTSIPSSKTPATQESKPAKAAPAASIPVISGPSHILLNHRAYTLPASTLYLGPASAGSAPSGEGIDYIELNDTAVGALLTIYRQSEGLILQYNPALQVNLNGKTLSADASLQLGDSISFDNSITTIQLIQVL